MVCYLFTIPQPVARLPESLPQVLWVPVGTEVGRVLEMPCEAWTPLPTFAPRPGTPQGRCVPHGPHCLHVLSGPPARPAGDRQQVRGDPRASSSVW